MQCYVPVCENSARNSSASNKVTFYEFPNEEKHRAAWFTALGRHEFKLSELRICEQHFNPEDIITINGLKTLKTDAIPLAVQTCAICLDTDRQFYSLSMFELEKAYTNLTGLSYDRNLSPALCAACAQRLISCSTFRDRSLMAHSILMELVETHSLTIQNIKSKREKILRTPYFNEKIFQPDQFDIYIQENNEYDLMEDKSFLNNKVDIKDNNKNNNNTRETSNEIDIQLKRLPKAGPLNKNKIVHRDETTQLPNEVKRELDLTEHERIETSNVIDIQPKRGLMSSSAVINDEIVGRDEIAELTSEFHIEVKSELDVSEDERIETLDMSASALVNDEVCALMNNEVFDKDQIAELTSEFHIEVKCEVDVTEDERIESLNMSPSAFINDEVPGLIEGGALMNNEFVDQDESTELENEVRNEVKRELDITEDERLETLNAINTQLNREKFRDFIKEEVNDGFNEDNEFDSTNVLNETSVMGGEYSNSSGNYVDILKYTDCYEELEYQHIYNEHSVFGHNSEVSRASKHESPADISMNDEFKTKKRHTAIRGNRNIIGSHTQQLAETYPNRIHESNIEIYNLKDHSKRNKRSLDTISIQGIDKQNLKRDKSEIQSKVKKTKTDNVDDKQITEIDKTENQVTNDENDESSDAEMRITLNKQFACNKCSYKTNHENYLKCHLQLHSNCVNPEKVYKCTECAYITSIEQNLTTHTTTHTGVKPYSCKICEYKTAFKRNLITHTRTHTGEKPYSCSKCDYRCSAKYYLISHMKAHTGDLPYSCNICEYKCNMKRKLTRHIATHSGAKPYTCGVCKFQCSQQSNLRAHMRIHTGEKPYSCSICEYRSTKKCSLDRHMRVHTGEKPFSCTICNHKTTTQYNLNTHMRTHTGEKPFACTQCDNRYCRLEYLVKHMKTH